MSGISASAPPPVPSPWSLILRWMGTPSPTLTRRLSTPLRTPSAPTLVLPPSPLRSSQPSFLLSPQPLPHPSPQLSPRPPHQRSSRQFSVPAVSRMAPMSSAPQLLSLGRSVASLGRDTTSSTSPSLTASALLESTVLSVPPT
jgi:hypothetical protein